MTQQGPGGYRSMEEFEREEIQPHKKVGWSLDDIYHESDLRQRDHALDEDPQELNFDI